MDLVIMAAGMGSRFGGLKQIEPVDTHGNFIIDYSIYDAIRCGFNKVIFVIKPETFNLFKSTIGKRIESKIETAYAFQTFENLPKETPIPTDRTKPLGTGHAVLCAKNHISGPFAVINADDFYGQESFFQIAKFLKTNSKPDTCALVGYNAINTLCQNKSVKRGVCKTQNGLLQNIVESIIEKKDCGLVAKAIDGTDEADYVLPPESIVSMNMFGFHFSFMNNLELMFYRFLKSNQDLRMCEFFLPTAVSNLIKENKLKSQVLSTNSKWLGITYKEDLEYIKMELSLLIKSGIYPKKLWN